MEDTKQTTQITITNYEASSLSRYAGLIDIPLSHRLMDAFISLFNYFDIAAPKMPAVYSIVTYIRFFQLIGGAFFAANVSSFRPGTLTYSAMSIISVLFHAIPLEYRLGNATYILFAINGIMIFFSFYLTIAAFMYKRTTKISSFSTYVLSIYVAIGPFILIPIIIQYTGQLVSAYIQREISTNAASNTAIVLTILVTLSYSWILFRCYTRSLVFRPCSFQSIEGAPQNRLFLTTICVTFVSSLTTYFTRYPSAAMIITSIFFYILSSSTVFRCGTFIRHKHQIMVLGGSILGICLCLANIYTVFIRKPWNETFFVGFLIVAVVTFVLTNLFQNYRERDHLRLLDEIDDTQDISVIKSKGKLKGLIATGFTHNHPLCCNLIIFKLAAEQWPTAIDIWAMYAKFTAIYPERLPQLEFIAMSINALNSKNSAASITVSGIGYIAKTRETKLTPQLKNKISKLQKLFNKTKNRIRNIWDLTLQGNTAEMAVAIKMTKDSVAQCDREMNYLLSQYPNNRYVARQRVQFFTDIEGDPIQAKKALETTAKIQRGYQVAPDIVHDLGIAAFPGIPEFIVEVDSSTRMALESERETIESERDISFIEESNNFDAVEQIVKQIERHKVPSISFIYTSTVLLYFLLIFVPLVILLIFYSYYDDIITMPLSFMHGIALTRNIIAMLNCFVGRLIFQELPDPKNTSETFMGRLQLAKNFPMTAFGGTRDTRDILTFIAQDVSHSNELMSKVRAFKRGNVHADKVRKLLFSNNINFSLYMNASFSYDTLTSVSEVSFMIASHVGKFLENDVLTMEVVKGMDSLTARHNNNLATQAMNDALDEMLEYLKAEDRLIQKCLKAVMITLILLNVILYPLIYYLQVKKLRQNRYEILKTLTTLPKTVISGISTSLSKLKDSNGDKGSSYNETELSRQEESIIKLFASISDGSSKSSIELSILLCFIAIIILSCCAYYTSINAYMESSENLVYNSHHINYLFGGAVYLFAIIARLFKVALAMADPSLRDTCADLENEITLINSSIPMLVNYFQLIRLGGEGKRELPFPNMEQAMDAASIILKCKDPIAPPKNSMDSVHCLTAAQQLYISTSYMKRYYALMVEEDPIFPDPRDIAFQQLFQIGPVELYQAFFYGAQESLIPLIRQEVVKLGYEEAKLAVFFIFSTFLISCIVLIAASNENKILKFTLKLFLRCPPQSIMTNQRVMDLLTGNYNYANDEQSGKHTWFSNEVVNRLDDVVIVCQDETSKVITVNASFENMFGIKKAEIEGKHINDFFTKEKFLGTEEEIQKVITQSQKLIYVKPSGEQVFFDLSTNSASGRRIYMGTNETLNVLHEKMIAEEKKKSDAMLASILPASLVPRVQAGEKNISFSVQSVTVLFLDIVSFTPWCGSHDAHYVMRMLNIMFKEFDAITNAHKTMTKIKCIGDCYMAAGGIFDEVNQPAVHAKEVVDFGCCVIKKLLEIDEAENESLRIRVGINTGGPIVAGVIGTEKPTFEILGPAINIAHEMESHGVPMKVHISRPVYELIYGQQFDIKERGEIDIKGGQKVFTYLVEP